MSAPYEVEIFLKAVERQPSRYGGPIVFRDTPVDQKQPAGSRRDTLPIDHIFHVVILRRRVNMLVAYHATSIASGRLVIFTPNPAQPSFLLVEGYTPRSVRVLMRVYEHP